MTSNQNNNHSTNQQNEHKPTKIKMSAVRKRNTNNNQNQSNSNNSNNSNNSSNNKNSYSKNRSNQNNQNQDRRNNRPNSNQKSNSTPRPKAGLKHLEELKEKQRQDTNKKPRSNNRGGQNGRPNQKTNERKSSSDRSSSNGRPNNRPQSNNGGGNYKKNNDRNQNQTRRNTLPNIPAAPEPVQNESENRNRKRVDHKKNVNSKNNWRNNKKKNNRHQEQNVHLKNKKPMPQRKEKPLPEVLVFEDGMNAQDLGKLLHREPAEVVKKLFMLGVMVNQNQSLDSDTIELIATDYGINSKEKEHEDISDIDKIFDAENNSTENQTPRPPVITIMGHVDHGKTTLLDHLRNTHVTDGEEGGITQHIGAYQVDTNDRLITFLDTPGHAAFTNMRARGADITDIIILVVAADDGVMPQTKEAINHAKAAGVPIIVAVNKIDKPDANPNHVMEQLMGYELIPEDWGGSTIFVPISAKTGENVDDLLEMILLQADVMELKANPEQKAVGTVIEARLDKGKGSVASLLVQQGTLRVGDPIVVGNTFGRVRVMTNDRGRRVKEAHPSEPVEITGLNGVPNSADRFAVFADEKTARAAGEERAKRALVEERNNNSRVTLDNLFDTMKEGELKQVDVIIKADVQGSAEALAGSLQKIEVEGVKVNIVYSGVGAINESDVTLATASNAIVIGFNVRPTQQVRKQAETENVDIRLYGVIYKAIDEIESAMKGMLDPEFQEKITGNLIVRETFHVSKLGTIAGAFVTGGSIQRDSGVRLIRNGIVIYEGKLSSLKRFKDDAKEVNQGFDCGLMIENYNDIKVDDEIEAYVMEEVPVK